MTVCGCQMCIGAVAMACLAASYLCELAMPCVLCFTATFGYAVGWDKNFIFKAFIFMPMIFMIHFFVPARLALGRASDSKALWDWVVSFAAYYSILFLLQDLRDVKGDAKSGRRTLPVLLGAQSFRAMLFVLVAVLSPPGCYGLLEALWAQQPYSALVCTLWNSGFALAILYMLATSDSVKADRLAHKLVVFLFMYTFGTAPCLYFIVPSVLASEVPLGFSA
ncbi:unnamed protein product [Symbiodinium necroappetens]|uniref:Uncharacterized protein n=1 Tax=Symbiodinium necroappetens TaxID=1628268 RepID=A0A812TUN3_9DINO|nr:unnamed protein product [Symbiodinium necroappetens]